MPGDVADGTAVKLIGKLNGFWKVHVEARTGFVKRQYLHADGSTWSVLRDDEANAALRKTADEGSAFVNALAPNTVVELLGSKNNFVEVRIGAREGYIKEAHVKEGKAPTQKKRKAAESSEGVSRVHLQCSNVYSFSLLVQMS